MAYLLVIRASACELTPASPRSHYVLASGPEGINISMINTSEVRVSVVVDRDRGEEALVALKEAFHIP